MVGVKNYVMKKNILSFIYLFISTIAFSQITLTHNVGDDLILNHSDLAICQSFNEYWARKFVLSDFGISENEEFIIDKGFVGLSGLDWSYDFTFNIYKVDTDFPTSFSEADLIGSSQTIGFSNSDTEINKIYSIDFENPVTVPANVKIILVEVHQGNAFASGGGEPFLARTLEDNDDSWYKGCASNTIGIYRTTNEIFPITGSDINFYIKVSGEVITIVPFEIINNNKCINFSSDFSLTNQSEIKSVVWNFDDPSSGADNTFTSIDVNHQFTSAGIYNVTAEVVHIDNTSYTISKEIEIFDAPNINDSVSLKQCDNSDINGFSFFNLNEVKDKIIANPENYTITFHEEEIDAENGTPEITNITKYQNEVVSIDTVWARVENANGCYEVSEVDLFVSTTQIPATLLKSYYQCDDGANTTDGIATFDFSEVTNDIIAIFPVNQQLIINYYRNEEDALAEENEITDIKNYQNIGYPNQQNIYIRVDSEVDNDCLGLGAHISLNVEKVPVANPVNINPECDNDRDGFYAFDTSAIHNTIIGSQTNVTVSYFDENGNQLSSPLPNPFSTASQKITARIENSNSLDTDGKCFDETTLDFVVNTVPIANIIAPQEACDDDFDGFVAFDTTNIESTIIGMQTGLVITYFDENNTPLPSPLPNPFLTASQTIRVRLENPIYDICYEETTVDFIVREKPTVNLISEDIICMTTNSELEIKVDNPNSDYTYTWRDENDNIVGNSFATTISKGGTYNVIATSKFGCDSNKEEIFIQESSISTVTINDIEVQDDSDNNFIKINTTNLGLGNYEFRLLDENSNIIYDYQDDPNFENLDGGNYILEVNDKNNCGTIPFEISLISFPNFFTPNDDGNNDYWQIKGLNNSFYKSGVITIFNRYGKSIVKFTIDDMGWNGNYNGKPLASNDYWFQVILVNQNNEIKKRSGNFSLIRN